MAHRRAGWECIPDAWLRVVTPQPDFAPPALEPPVAMTVDTLMAYGIKLHQGGLLVDAERAYRAVLSAEPNQVDALHFLGLLLHQAGFEKDGIELVSRAVELAPGYVDAQCNLGNLLRSAGRLPEAAAAYRRAFDANPAHVQALNNLGVALKDLKDYEQAIAVLRQAIALNPQRGDAHHNLANVLTMVGQHEEAIIEYRRAIELQPVLIHAYDALSRALRGLGQADEAAAVLRQLVKKVPDNPIVQHMLAAWTGENVPDQAPENYVQHIFDNFADTFDHVLRVLEYRAPQLIADAIAEEPPKPGSLDVLDAGCGTGLCGPLLKPHAKRLTGVDLSKGMLAKARNREVYDDLVQAELTRFMQENGASFDLIASADTLVYFGDLLPLLQAASGALRPNGRLFFTVEDGGDDIGPGFQLQQHGRYNHRESYIRETLERAGLTVRSIKKAVLRKEKGDPGGGLLVSARK